MFEYLFFNFKKYEELAFVGSNIKLPKNEFKHILYAEMDDKENSSSELPNYKIEVEEKKSIFNFFKNLFKKKPQIYRIGNGESVELDGSMPGNPISGFFNRIGEKIEQFMNKGKEISAATAIKNNPEIYSTALTETSKSTQKENSLLNEVAPSIENSGIIIPQEVSANKKQTNSYIQSTPIKAENLDVDEKFEENKDEFTDILDKLSEAQEGKTAKPELTEINVQPITNKDKPEKNDDNIR